MFQFFLLNNEIISTVFCYCGFKSCCEEHSIYRIFYLIKDLKIWENYQKTQMIFLKIFFEVYLRFKRATSHFNSPKLKWKRDWLILQPESPERCMRNVVFIKIEIYKLISIEFFLLFLANWINFWIAGKILLFNRNSTSKSHFFYSVLKKIKWVILPYVIFNFYSV